MHSAILIPTLVQIIVFHCGFKWSVVDGEVFTSVEHMQSLVDIERQLLGSLRRYVAEEEKKLTRIRAILTRSVPLGLFNSESDSETLSRYMRHPLNALRMIGRLTKDWRNTEKMVGIDFSRDFLYKFSKFKDIIPSDEDVKGAEDALIRLQETYDLAPSVISEGIAPQRYPLSKMSAQDAFKLGLNSYKEKKFEKTELWMRETLRLLELGRTGDEPPARFDVLDYLAWVEYQNGRTEAAYNHTLELHELDPKNERITMNVRLFKRHLREQKERDAKMKQQQQEFKQSSTDKKQEKEKPIKYKKFYYTENENEYARYLVEKEIAKRLCRGLVQPIPKSHTKDLVCWHVTRKPYFVIKPARLERIYKKPEIVFFRGVMNDDDIKEIKRIANPKLNRATVHNPRTGKLEFADYRVSKSAWLAEGEVVHRLNRQIERLTGLDMETAELLQIANYGIAGHYETHFDFSRHTPMRPPPWKAHKNVTHHMKHEISRSQYLTENGNRVATFLLYLTDVEAGGGTVFTNIGALVTPSKGDAVFWYNLYRDGAGDFDTRHAACPVLIGEKWVANKWIHERGQEFRRKCGLKPDSV